MPRLLRLVASLLLLAPTLHAQSKLVFDVAAIHLSPAGEAGLEIKPLPAGDGYSVHNSTVQMMIAVAYGVPMWQIKGSPVWAGGLGADRYDIEAKTDHKDSMDNLHLMLQNLLADRFNLRMHKETRKGRVYTLSTDMHGSKMKVDENPTDLAIPMMPRSRGVWVGTGVSMPYLCRWLGNFALSHEEERPVIDKTGLEKAYDFTLSFNPPNSLIVDGEKVIRPETENLASTFEALKTQLGLRLREEEGDVQYFVIDSIDKPSAN